MDLWDTDVFTFHFPSVFLYLHHFCFRTADQHAGFAAVIAASRGFFAAAVRDSDGRDG